MRLFVGVFPSEEVRLDLRERLGRTTRTVPDERWHVTLVFLGEVADPAVVERALDDVVSPGPFRLRLSGGGAFGHGRRTVLWAGVEGELSQLRQLRAATHGALELHEDKPFSPHLTLAYANHAGIRAALTDYAGPTWTVATFALVHSLHAEGGGYQVVREWKL